MGKNLPPICSWVVEFYYPRVVEIRHRVNIYHTLMQGWYNSTNQWVVEKMDMYKYTTHCCEGGIILQSFGKRVV